MPDLRDIRTLSQILEILAKVPPTRRQNLIDAVSAFYSHTTDTPPILSGLTIETQAPPSIPFSSRMDLTAAEFLEQKNASGVMNQLVCLAFYIKHYLESKRFSRSQIFGLYSEATGNARTEPMRRLRDAVQKGYLTRHTGEEYSITTKGEQFVASLPSRKEFAASKRSSQTKKLVAELPSPGPK